MSDTQHAEKTITISIYSISPEEFGEYRTRSGEIAILNAFNISQGKWMGKIEGQSTRTWWHKNGAHNTFRSDDLMEKL